MLELIIGGARSGKSSLALERASESGRAVTFIATAQPSDAEMQARIARHRAERPTEWRTIEEPMHLAEVLGAAADPKEFIIIDCLTLWLSNVLFRAEGERFELDEVRWLAQRQAFIEQLQNLKCDAVLVSNELGLGIVPESAAVRRFRDEQGRLNQELARVCDRVTFVAAGLPLSLKGA